jgi:hypothetical protein
MLDAGTETEATSAPSFAQWGWTGMCSSCNRRSFLAKATAAMAGAVAGFAATTLEVAGQQPPNRARQQANRMFMRQPTAVAHHVRAVGYSELDGRPAFKMSIREHRGRWYLYTGHFWHSGWSIIDVTDPAAPHVVRFIPGPAHTWTLQMELSGNTMITALERPFPNFGGDPQQPFMKACSSGTSAIRSIRASWDSSARGVLAPTATSMRAGVTCISPPGCLAIKGISMSSSTSATQRTRAK